MKELVLSSFLPNTTGFHFNTMSPSSEDWCAVVLLARSLQLFGFIPWAIKLVPVLLNVSQSRICACILLLVSA